MTKEEALKTFISKGGLSSYFKTVDTQEIEKKALDGDKRAALILDAMAYNIAKEIGSDATVLSGEVDAIGLTRGLSNSKYLPSRIKARVSFIAPVFIFPGESEMEALAHGALRCLRGEAEPIIFKGKPLTFTKFDEIEDYIRKSRRVKKIALCGSHDEPALKSFKNYIPLDVVLPPEERDKAALASRAEKERLLKDNIHVVTNFYGFVADHLSAVIKDFGAKGFRHIAITSPV